MDTYVQTGETYMNGCRQQQSGSVDRVERSGRMSPTQ